MFGDFFATQDDLLNKDQVTTVPTFAPSQSKNCAFALDLPPLHREHKHFVGLKNQGGTCYLNSLIQTLFMSPEFRKEIFKLPLCVKENHFYIFFIEDFFLKEGTIEKNSNFVDSNKKHLFLLAIQKLFYEMQNLDLRTIR